MAECEPLQGCGPQTMLYTASPWLASPSDPNPRGSQDLGYQAATKWGRKQNWWKVCMKRHTLRLLPLFYSAQATAPLLPGRIPSVYSLEALPSWGWGETSMKKFRPSLWTDWRGCLDASPFSSQGLAVRFTHWGRHWEPLSGNWLAGEKTHNTDMWRSLEETVASPVEEPFLPMYQDSHKLLAAFWYLPPSSTYIFITEKCKHIEKFLKYYNEHPYTHLVSSTIVDILTYMLYL